VGIFDVYGHLWGERFFSRIIEDAEDFEHVSAYIDRNPVKAKLVWQETDWEFGGLSYWLRGIRGLIDECLWTGFFAPRPIAVSDTP
jgi:putative transposase